MTREAENWRGGGICLRHGFVPNGKGRSGRVGLGGGDRMAGNSVYDFKFQTSVAAREDRLQGASKTRCGVVGAILFSSRPAVAVRWQPRSAFLGIRREFFFWRRFLARSVWRAVA